MCVCRQSRDILLRDPSVPEAKAGDMRLVVAIPRFNADTFWDGLLGAFQLSLGVDFGQSLSISLSGAEPSHVALVWR